MKKILGLIALLLLPACSQEKVIAKIGSDKITLSMLEARLKEAPQGYRGYLDTMSGKKQFLDLLIRERMVLDIAKREGYDKKQEYVKAVADFTKDQEKRLRDYKENMLMEYFVKDLQDKTIKATDADTQEYYQAHKQEFDRPVEIKARHILVANKADAEKALSRIKAGEDFGKVAKEMSTDPISAPRGGEIGPFRKGDLVPEFETAVFNLKLGQVSDVVETQFGFHIIKKISEKLLPMKPLEEAKVEMKRIIEKTKFDKWLEDSKKKYLSKVNYEVLNLIAPLSTADQEPMTVNSNAMPGKVAPKSK